MDKETLLIALKEKGATESALMEIGCSYIFHSVSSALGIIGYAVVVVNEGLLSLPCGMDKQFLLSKDKAIIISPEDLEMIIADDFISHKLREKLKELSDKAFKY